MKKLFHYDVIYFIALAVGFSKDEAIKTATASQYVDDATEHEPITLNNIPSNIADIRITDKNTFNPVCTAHKGVKGVLESLFDGGIYNIFKKIYIPFHFIPASKSNPITIIDLITINNCQIAINLVDDAVTELKSNQYPINYDCSLIKLGIALHSYADTWAHEGFSGTFTDNNKISNLKPSDSSVLSLKAGHLQVGDLPDTPNAVYSFNYKNTNKTINRNNKEIYLDASEHIYNILATIKCCTTTFENAVIIDDIGTLNLKNVLTTTFEHDLSAVNIIPLYQEYDVTTKNPPIEYYYFHREALIQRQKIQAIMGNIPNNIIVDNIIMN